MIMDAQQAQKMKDFQTAEELITGGVELVPLLARRRGAAKRYFLPSTDITKIQHNPGQPTLPRQVYRPTLNEREYFQELTNQVINKELRRKESKQEDLIKSRRHFETVGGFWGRPGHGAPKEVVVKENLNNLLYHTLPVH
uniref:Uncharacterized protein n=2 Tax=Clastoptera arizonana TaxID=38151 RepID=A0A1B6DJZ0_9HEMI